MATVTIREVLFTYLDAREAFKLFTNMGFDREQARNTVALLLWLELATDIQAVQHVREFNGQAIQCLAEANSILAWLRAEPMNRPPFPDIPFMSSLCINGSINSDFFINQQNHVMQGVTNILDGVGVLIFDDNLYRLYKRFSTGLFPHYQELEAPYTVQVTVPEHYRSMFISFSRGQPIEREEIFDYFRWKWGDCIVRVLMEKTVDGQQSMYGRVIFKSEVFVRLVLNGEHRVSITINYREMWLRRYIPRNNV